MAPCCPATVREFSVYEPKDAEVLRAGLSLNMSSLVLSQHLGIPTRSAAVLEVNSLLLMASNPHRLKYGPSDKLYSLWS